MDNDILLRGAGLAGAASGNTLLSGLIGYWRFDEDPRPDDAVDSSGNNHTLVTNEGEGDADPKLGANAVLFAGGAVFTHADHTDFEIGTGTRYWSCWIKFNTSAATQTIFGKNDGITENEYCLYHIGATDKVAFAVYPDGLPSSEDLVQEDITENDDTWHLIEAYCSEGEIGIAVDNGAFVTGTTEANIPGTTQDFRVGTSGLAGAWSGRIDELAMWNRLLDAEEREALWNGGVGFDPTA